ncbi:MAG TPA: hypothetical protein VHF92_18220 [Geodermatophilus sp.]|nr:hypothetical protein [Geodermatophilus sp.]
MTASKTSPDDRADKAEPSEKRSILSAVQIAAGALAAVSAAVVASFFGVAGTLIGAALASVISTVSATLYGESLRRTNERLRQVRSRLTGQAGAPAREPDATRVLPTQLDPRRAPVKWRPRWPRLAAGAVAVFALAMGIVTGVELIGQQPVSALVGGSSASGTTTIGALTNVASHRDRTPSTPDSPTTPAPATSSAESTPTDAPSETAPETATGEPDPADPSATETSESAPGSSASRSAGPTDRSEESSEETPAPDGDQSTVP